MVKDTRPLLERRNEFERNVIAEALDEHKGNVRRAARALGLSKSGLYKRMKVLGITGETATEGESEQDGPNEV